MTVALCKVYNTVVEKPSECWARSHPLHSCLGWFLIFKQSCIDPQGNPIKGTEKYTVIKVHGEILHDIENTKGPSFAHEVLSHTKIFSQIPQICVAVSSGRLLRKTYFATAAISVVVSIRFYHIDMRLSTAVRAGECIIFPRLFAGRNSCFQERNCFFNKIIRRNVHRCTPSNLELIKITEYALLPMQYQ